MKDIDWEKMEDEFQEFQEEGIKNPENYGKPYNAYNPSMIVEGENLNDLSSLAQLFIELASNLLSLDRKGWGGNDVSFRFDLNTVYMLDDEPDPEDSSFVDGYDLTGLSEDDE